MKKLDKTVKEKVDLQLKSDPDMTKYFEDMANDPKLERLDKPCKDCAVTTGFYKPFAEELTKQTPGLQEQVLDTWFCHDHCNRACRGAYNYVQMKNRKAASEEFTE